MVISPYGEKYAKSPRSPIAKINISKCLECFIVTLLSIFTIFISVLQTIY